MDDLRTVLETGQRGAPVQGFSLLSSVYEVEATLLEIGRDPSKGERWLTEEGETGKVFAENRNGKLVKKKLKEMGAAFYPSLGIAGITPSTLEEAHERRYGEVYKELCAYKHIQPSLQRQYGTVRIPEGIEVQPGPQWTSYMRNSVLALYEVAENLAEHIFLAAAKAHLDPEQEFQAVRFIKQMRSGWHNALYLAMLKVEVKS